MLPESVLNVVTEAEPYVQNKRDTSPILKAATSSQSRSHTHHQKEKRKYSEEEEEEEMSSGSILGLVSPKETTRSSAPYQFIRKKNTSWRTHERKCRCAPIYSSGFAVSSSLVAGKWRSTEEMVSQVVLKQASLAQEQRRAGVKEEEEAAAAAAAAPINWNLLVEAYERCGEVCAEYAKTFYLGNSFHQQPDFIVYCFYRRFLKLLCVWQYGMLRDQLLHFLSSIHMAIFW